MGTGNVCQTMRQKISELLQLCLSSVSALGRCLWLGQGHGATEPWQVLWFRHLLPLFLPSAPLTPQFLLQTTTPQRGRRGRRGEGARTTSIRLGRVNVIIPCTNIVTAVWLRLIKNSQLGPCTRTETVHRHGKCEIPRHAVLATGVDVEWTGETSFRLERARWRKLRCWVLGDGCWMLSFYGIPVHSYRIASGALSPHLLAE